VDLHARARTNTNYTLHTTIGQACVGFSLRIKYTSGRNSLGSRRSNPRDTAAIAYTYLPQALGAPVQQIGAWRLMDTLHLNDYAAVDIIHRVTIVTDGTYRLSAVLSGRDSN